MCNCIEEVQEALKSKGNTMLDIPISATRDGLISTYRVRVATCKRDPSSRVKPIALLPSFCPFCGEPYAPNE